MLGLGRALHVYGTPAHRLEDAMELCSRLLGVPGQFFSTPTAVFAAFDGVGGNVTRLLRIGPGMVDLHRLVQVDAIMNQVVRGELDPQAGQQALLEVERARPIYNRAVQYLAFALVSAGAALFFGGGPAEIGFASVAGLVTGLLAEWVGRSRTSISIVEPLAAMVAAGGGLLWSVYLQPIDTSTGTLAALILLVPGFTLTVAMSELATRNLISGTARLTFAVVVLLGIGFGVAIGQQLGRVLPPLPQASVAVIPLWAEGLSLFTTAGALAVCFRAHMREYPWILVSCVVAYGAGSLLGALDQRPEVAAFVGALLVGVASSLYAWAFDRPTAVTQVPGIMLLVPGALGLRSVSSILNKDTLPGVEGAFQMVMVGTAIVTGLLVANLIVPRRKIL